MKTHSFEAGLFHHCSSVKPVMQRTPYKYLKTPSLRPTKTVFSVNVERAGKEVHAPPILKHVPQKNDPFMRHTHPYTPIYTIIPLRRVSFDGRITFFTVTYSHINVPMSAPPSQHPKFYPRIILIISVSSSIVFNSRGYRSTAMSSSNGGVVSLACCIRCYLIDIRTSSVWSPE